MEKPQRTIFVRCGCCYLYTDLPTYYNIHDIIFIESIFQTNDYIVGVLFLQYIVINIAHKTCIK